MKKYIVILIFLNFSCSTPIVTIDEAIADTQIASGPTFANSQLFQLADPILSINSRLFTESTTATLLLNYPDTNIHYTLDGSDPSESSNRYTTELEIYKSGILKAKAFHKDYEASNSVKASFLKIDKKLSIEKMEMSPQPHKNYAGKGTKTLFDYQKGGLNFRTNEWLGFNGDNVEIILQFSKKTSINQLIISTISDMGSWIFPPAAIEIWEMKDTQTFDLIAKETFDKSDKMQPPSLDFLALNIPSKEVKIIKIVVRNNGPIPEWHDGKGTPAWLFLDEIILQ